MPTCGYIPLQAITARYKYIHGKFQPATSTYVHKNYSRLMYLVAGYNAVKATRELGLGISLGNYSLLRCL